jgi:catechol 2,3-dioxygenase-like lactoylglutathione lyase family enzyme
MRSGGAEMVQFTDAFSGFAVPDLETARSFYGDVLGLEVGEEMGQLALTLPGGARVFVYQKDDHQPAVFTILNLVVDDIEAAVDEMVDKGVRFAFYEGFDQDARGISRGMGMEIAWCTDPAGNIIGVIGDAAG